MTKQPFLPYSRQHVGEDDIAAVADVLRSDFLTTGPKVDEFEAAFAARVDANHAVACSSGTAALHLSTASIGLSSGDTAIVPAVTFLATANAVRFTGADVVFADIDPDTGLMTPDSAEAALRGGEASNCKSILPVHLNGQCCDIAGLKELADGKGLRVIEDACHVLGGTYQDGLSVGACQHGNLTVFSAHPVKAIAMGEGGVVTTNDDSMADRLRRLRNHGMVRDSDLFESIDQAFSNDRTPNPWYYEMAEMGFNYRASDIHCALGLSQMTKFDDFVATQNKLVDAYAERLAP
ncbi:MAG TPA: UDP-4-amino-4,6-dideoxy-N-acetyl-beta-L-altrosamine transaminase, partial [Rhodospirillaceae bacterium]|nr:UDP-4-amino-4,6-dideoxy-N-acetyl-beta-L-altrosamine transaminase [Rhodospirillaceae bacterium]